MITHITVPVEIADYVTGPLRDRGCHVTDETWNALSLVDAREGLPSYDETLRELDLWRRVGFWSNMQTVIRTEDGLDTEALVDMVANDTQLYEEVFGPYAEEVADESNLSFEEALEWIRNEPSDEERAVMNELREKFRLDHVIYGQPTEE